LSLPHPIPTAGWDLEATELSSSPRSTGSSTENENGRL
jgi:hypothetical protein